MSGYETWEETYNMISKLIRMEFMRHSELLDSNKISDKQYIQRVIGEQANENDLQISPDCFTL